MASSSRDKPRKAKGIRIDSSLISTTSSGDIQNGLEGLGVSVFDQGTFEEGVMKQLDEEVSRRTVEQQRRFLMEEYSRVRQERNTLRRELESLSKKIAALLSRPLCDVVLTLREMKSAQEQKRIQVIELEVKEQELLKKISGNDADTCTGCSNIREEGVVHDAAFTVPMTSWSSEQQKLIQSGHMTPFGTSGVNEKEAVDGQSGADERTGTQPSGVEEVNGLVKLDETAPSTSSGLRLCSEGFDGLFEVRSTPTCTSGQTVRRKGLSPPGVRRKRKGKERSTESHVVDGDEVLVKSGGASGGDVREVGSEGASGEEVREVGSGGASGEDVREVKSGGASGEEVGSGGASGEDVREVGDEWMPTREEVEQLEREMVEEGWEDDRSTEYTTDEELGADHVLGRVRFGGVKKPKRRPLSSEESEDGEGGRWGRRRRRKRRKSSQAGCHLDDGDEELYRLRMKEYEREQRDSDETASSSSDKVIDGRLRVPGSVWSRLYGYQRTGVHWLWELHCQQAGGVVGDEMGLGKTIQMIAFLAALRVSQLRSHVTRELGLGAVLIVCPATVMHQWVSEFHTWWPQFRVAVLHDTGTYRGPKSTLIEDIVECNGVLITTYAGVRIYHDPLLSRKWDYIILDEGHKIRNPDTGVTLVCKQFSTPHRIILSGSPMQNSLRELWSLFDFVFPGKLGTLPVFMEQFSVPITLGGYSNATQVQVQTAYRCACVLRDTINPYLLRRLKADVKIQLPSKNEQVLFCKLTDYQQELYEDYVTGPDVASMLAGRKKIFTGLMVLRKLCNHPDLVTNDYRECVTYGKGVEGGRGEGGEDGDGEEDEEDTALIRTRRPPRTRWKRTTSIRDSGVEGEEVVQGYCEEQFGWGQRSGKMIVVETLLKMWFEQKHRVLLFSQSKMMLSVLELMIRARGYSYVRMDGDTPIAARQPLIQRFNENSSIFVFLLTTRVGGLGVNLTGADRVVIYDPDWNPSTDTQARERAWRIGQKRQVTIYRLITSGTIEEKIYHRQIFKQFLSNRVLKDPRQRRFFKANDLYELFSLGQIRPKGETETSAIFAGTGSDVIPPKLKKRRSCDRLHNAPPKSRDLGIELLNKSRKLGKGKGERRSRKDGEWNGDSQKRRKHSVTANDYKSENRSENTLEDHMDSGAETERRGREGGNKEIEGGGEGGRGGEGEGVEEGSGEESNTVLTNRHSFLETQSVPNLKETQDAGCDPSTSSVAPDGLSPQAHVTTDPDGMEMSESEKVVSEKNKPNSSSDWETRGVCSGGLDKMLPCTSDQLSGHSNDCKVRDKHKKKKNKHKKHRKRKHGSAVIEGVEISGVDRTGLYTAEREDKNKGSSHDDYILTKLFKKSGVHSAIQHDSIMSSGNSDYIVVETEAKRVAQSAARALRESRRRCLRGGERGGGWGQLTWTGQHGSAGGSVPRQQPRFGAKANQTQSKGKVMTADSSKLFNGQKAGTSLLTSEPSQPPTHTSSSALLTKMRSRNAHSLPWYAIKGIHESTHDVLLREIRDFIATRCKVDGMASTEELLGHFSSKLPNSDTATFRSMLREICDFSRIRGEGRWILKSQFR